jgi:hypothetical protein
VDQCDGASVACQHPAGNAGAVCRPALGLCDLTETCTGASADCPPDALEPAGTGCRPAAGDCDLAESCDGATPACPADALVAAGTECRPAAGECDVAESCDGAAVACPANARQPAGTSCTDDGNVCTDDACDGAGTCAHAHNTAPCDDGLFCNGVDVCAAGSCTHPGDPCPGADGDADCAETCDEGLDACVAPDPDGAGCDDGLFCTVSDACQAGVCEGGPRDCSAEDGQCRTGTCDEDTDACIGPPKPDGTPCTLDPCVVGQVCTDGACGGGTPTPSACIDHVLCYKAKTTLRTPRFVQVPDVTLEDQLEFVTAAVRKPTSICPAVDKNGEGVIDPDTHHTAYLVRAIPAVRRSFIQVTDQLGTLRVNTTTADRLLVPTAIGVGDPPAGPPAPGAANHYRCYRLKLTPGTGKFPKGLQATVADPFQTKLLDVVRPRRLCIPVDKNGEGVPHPVAHLMCYQVKPANGEPRHTAVVGQLHLQSQFGALRLDTVKEEELCVPATMGF